MAKWTCPTCERNMYSAWLAKDRRQVKCINCGEWFDNPYFQEKTPEIIEWSEEGYPTEESLQNLRDLLNQDDYRQVIPAFYNALRSNFYYECAREERVEVRGEVIDVWAYHTLGWRGNEMIISVLQEFTVFKFLLERYDGGGHYYFKREEDV